MYYSKYMSKKIAKTKTQKSPKKNQTIIWALTIAIVVNIIAALSSPTPIWPILTLLFVVLILIIYIKE